jgi:hypothetical protein
VRREPLPQRGHDVLAVEDHQLSGGAVAADRIDDDRSPGRFQGREKRQAEHAAIGEAYAGCEPAGGGEAAHRLHAEPVVAA